MRNRMMMGLCISCLLWLAGCGGDDDSTAMKTPYEEGRFLFGADLSYANQIVDHGGVFKDGGEKSPYEIFANHGTGLVRLRLWHNPTWTKTVYGEDGTQLYNDLDDVKRSIEQAHQFGMRVLLDFHYSDNWTDPGKNAPPAAWLDITDIDVLKDSVYNYTLKTLQHLEAEDLLPEFVQLGNEINCGMFYTGAPEGFPSCNVCDDNAWSQLGIILNAGIKAVRDVSASASVKPVIILHVADPKNVNWWFDNIQFSGLVTDFDRIGFSYYPLWHTTIPVKDIEAMVKGFVKKYGKDVMILETAYPWTNAGADDYTNLFGGTPIAGYPFTTAGQSALITDLAKAVINGGGAGIVYWEPDWITSAMKDQWGAGSAWENATFFDFEGNVHEGINFMTADFGK